MKIKRYINYLLTTLLVSSLICACDDEHKQTEQNDALKQQAPSKTTIKNSYDAKVINFEGFGPAKFGSNEESVRMAWEKPLNASKPDKGATCYYLYSDHKPKSHQGIAFMLEDGRFVRYDIDDLKWVAPGNILVGDSMVNVMQAHAGHIDNQPHKYIEGAHTLIVTPDKSSNARLIFETDANNVVKSWRIGVAPQIYYVEGCN